MTAQACKRESSLPAVSELEQQVREAFTWRPFPGADQVLFHRGSCPTDEARNLYLGRDWQAVLEAGRAGEPRFTMECLSPRGFAYHLPAFLILALEPDDPVQHVDSLGFQLHPHVEMGRTLTSDFFSRLLVELTGEEKQAIRETLEHVTLREEARGWTPSGAREALEAYWSRFPEEPVEMPKASRDVADLRTRIETAFGDKERPETSTLCHRQPVGSEVPEPARELFREEDWHGVLERGRKHDPRIDPRVLSFGGFTYFLPAFLLLSLETEPDRNVKTATLFWLWAWPDAIHSHLQPPERRAVVATLEHLAARHAEHEGGWNEAHLALMDGWAGLTDEELGIS